MLTDVQFVHVLAKIGRWHRDEILEILAAGGKMQCFDNKKENWKSYLKHEEHLFWGTTAMMTCKFQHQCQA